MKKKLLGYVCAALWLFQGCDSETITPDPNFAKSDEQSTSGKTAAINTVFVSTTGNDAADGTSEKPWKSLKYAVTKVPVNQAYVIQLSAGTFIEHGPIEIPSGVSVAGAGIDKTILKAETSFHYNPASPGYALEKFLIRLNQATQTNGNQTLSGFTIDGDSKKLHGGIYVRNRNAVTIENVKVQNTNFTGIWLWDVKDSKVRTTQLINCSWGSSGYSSGALNLGNLERVEIDRLDVNENTGYGIKAIGPNGNTNIISLKIHDSRISVHPVGLWNNGSAPNIAIELWQVNLVGAEIYNTYVDNTISLVNSNALPSTGVQTIRVHHNIIDMETRAKGAGYGVELTLHDAEIDHNYFIKGTNGIANWDHAMKNWYIHHNTFYALQGTYPGEVVRSQKNGLHNVKLYNNTIEFTGNKTMNVIGIYGGTSEGIDLKNNLFINNNTGYSYYPNKLIHQENGAILNNLTVKNNLFWQLPIGTVPGAYANNLTSDPKIAAQGARPNPYYMLAAGSPLIDAGVNVGYSFAGSAPDIGAWEHNSSSSSPPTTGATVTRLDLDSSDATLSGNVTTGYDAQAKNGNYFHVPAGTGNNYSIPPPGIATFNFQLPKTDNYVVWARVISPTSSNQAYSIYNGQGKWFIWRAGINTAWTWVKITNGGAPELFSFSQGSNQIKMGWYDDNVKIDQIIITNDLTFIP